MNNDETFGEIPAMLGTDEFEPSSPRLDVLRLNRVERLPSRQTKVSFSGRDAMHALVWDLGMPRNPEQKSQKALARGKLEVHAGAKVSSSAAVRLRLFEEAVQAVHVTPIEEGWQVFRIGTDPRVFPEKSQAINFAEIDAKKYNVPALIHESGQARTIS